MNKELALVVMNTISNCPIIKKQGWKGGTIPGLRRVSQGGSCGKKHRRRRKRGGEMVDITILPDDE